MSASADLQVVRVPDDQVMAAFQVLQQVAQWLADIGRRQRIGLTSWETYRDWQQAMANYAVLKDWQIAGIFSLPREPLTDWPQMAIDHDVIWLRALATNPKFRGQRIGETAIQAALDIYAGQPIYLDCVSDFLPDYYASTGFQFLLRQTKHNAEGGPLDITLMRHDNQRSSIENCLSDF